MSRACNAGTVSIGAGRPLTIIAGPCVLESLELGITIGRHVKALCRELGLGYIFKASFDKANRSSINSPRGPGLERGVGWLKEIAQDLGTPCTTDIHEPAQAEVVARHVDLIQIPAFLCRQTDLLVAAGEAAAKHSRAVNVKKGQFMSPREMGGAIKKLDEAGCANVMLTERGTFFGYGRLVNDFLGVADMMQMVHASADGRAVPVCFDCTHSTQQPGHGGTGPGGGEVTGGRSDRAPALARAATALGVHALFIECHPEPKGALSDAATMVPLTNMGALLRSVAALHRAIEGTAVP